MSEDKKLQKKLPAAIKEKGQYFLAFGVIASMLLVAQIPMFVIIFFGIFAFFLWKIFSSGSRNETRDIFEFYLSAHEMLRDDDRKWYGFEMQETISRGEKVLQAVKGAPPLVYFTLGALYNKIGAHDAAAKNLEFVLENEGADEANYTNPSPELRNYVRILRKIEREPAEAPLTSSAVRALERARRNRARTLLEDSRKQLADVQQRREQSLLESGLPLTSQLDEQVAEEKTVPLPPVHREAPKSLFSVTKPAAEEKKEEVKKDTTEPRRDGEDPFTHRKPITEVLHDIYDKNIQ